MKNQCLIAFLLLLGACQSQKVDFSGNAATGDAKADLRKEAPVEAAPEDTTDERVDVPQNIAGASLTCSERKRATQADLEAEFGCRLNEAGTNDKIDIDASQLLWSANIEAANLRIDANPANPAWHAIYAIRGESLDDIRNTARSLNIRVAYQGEAGKAIAPLRDQKLQEVARPITNSGDEDAPIFTQGIDPTDPGPL